MGLGKRLRYQILFPALARLPLPLAYGLAAGIGIWDLCRDGAARRAVMRGLRLLFPQLTPWARIGIALRHFIMKAWECLDAFVMARGRAGNLVRVAGVEILSRAQAQGKGVILVMAHFGRLNLHGLGLALAGKELGMLTQAVDGHDLDGIERAYLKRKAATLHAYLHGRWITLGGRLRELYRELEQGEIITILLDAYAPRWEKHAVHLPFLGGFLALPSGILRLARRTGARLVYGWTVPEGFRVCGLLTALPEELEAAFQEAVRHLEENVRRRPWMWWQWPIVGTVWRRADAIGPVQPQTPGRP